MLDRSMRATRLGSLACLVALGLGACSSAGKSASSHASSSGTGASASAATSTGSAATGGARSSGASNAATVTSTGPGSGSSSGLGPAAFVPGDLDPPSDGATITFEQVGAAGWYPTIRDPATGPCDVASATGCCRTMQTITSDQLTPWNEELVMTLRGPMEVKQIAVYQPAMAGGAWALASGWDSRTPGAPLGMAGMTFSGDATPKADFVGGVGTECLVNISTATTFPCGSGSTPYCTAPPPDRYYGWAGPKLFVVLATMPHAGTAGAPAACSTTTTGNWYDASWVGLSIGELARAGSFSSCQCYAKSTTNPAAADGCGQFNVFEVVNDNGSYKNLDVFSTDLIDYSGYVGQGPCGPKCDVSALGTTVDLIDKTNDTEATAGAVATPAGGPTAAFRRPASGYRYFLIALDVASRTVQLGMVHPEKVPASLAALLPNLPASVPQATIDSVLALRLPK